MDRVRAMNLAVISKAAAQLTQVEVAGDGHLGARGRRADRRAAATTAPAETLKFDPAGPPTLPSGTRKKTVPRPPEPNPPPPRVSG